MSDTPPTQDEIDRVTDWFRSENERKAHAIADSYVDTLRQSQGFTFMGYVVDEKWTQRELFGILLNYAKMSE